MTASDDLDDVPNHLVPEELADRLLAGGAPPADAHDTVVATAAVLRAAAGPATGAERAAADAAATSLARTVVLTPATTVLAVSTLAHPRRRRLGVPGRIAAGVVVATLCSAGAAAAATGHLPDPLQRTVAGAASHVGLSLPDPRHVGHGAVGELADGASATTTAASTSSSAVATSTSEATAASPTTATTAASTSSSSTEPSVAPSTDADQATSPSSVEGTERSDASTPAGPSIEGPAKRGLCTAYAQLQKNGSDPNGVAFASLRMAAEARGMTVLEFCADVLAPTSEPSTGSSTPGASSSVPRPKGPPATIKGPDEPVDTSIATATMPSNTPAITITVKPGNGGGGGGGGNNNPNG